MVTVACSNNELTYSGTSEQKWSWPFQCDNTIIYVNIYIIYNICMYTQTGSSLFFTMAWYNYMDVWDQDLEKTS